MSKIKPLAAISLDLDNQWSYMKIHGDKGWEKFPSYLETFVPYVLNILDELNLKITFFIVGQDAVLEKNKKFLRMITERGHDVGNHSFHHESWIQNYSKEEIEEEIRKAEIAIIEATGKKPRGFRGPGFTWSNNLIEVLHESNYDYDASSLPTYIGPFARLFYFRTAKLSKNERKERNELFGSFKDGLKPLKPFYRKLPDNNSLLEIPVTTIPVFKIPFHLSYLLYISNYSIGLMKLYLNFAIFMCRITGTKPSFLLHPLDLIGGDQVPELAFFPGMNISSTRKVKIFKLVVETLQKHYNLVNMNEFAKSYYKFRIDVPDSKSTETEKERVLTES